MNTNFLSPENRTAISKVVPTPELVYSYDLGVGFTLITSDGVYEEQGGNFSEWPLYRFRDISDSSRTIISHSIETRMFSLEILKGTSLEAFAALVEDYNKNNEDKKSLLPIFKSVCIQHYMIQVEIFSHSVLWNHGSTKLSFFPHIMKWSRILSLAMC